MIDCHIHTKLSRHGEGDLEDFINVALEKGIKVLGFSEHGPFIFDEEHRLTVKEAHAYIKDINRLKRKYADRIKLLAGFEMDYLPEAEKFIEDFLGKLEFDFVLGGVHFIPDGKEIVSVWKFEKLQQPQVWTKYYKIMREAAASLLFDGMMHPDILLRAGLPEQDIKENQLMLVDSCCKYGLAYELNASGMTKPKYCPQTKQMTSKPSYPDIEIAKIAYARQVPIIIGSDAHSPDTLGKNIPELLQRVKQSGVDRIAYIEQRNIKYISL